ncbi:low-density lipoprotein receptor-related protein 1B-like isoform X3 [Cherax quadricarinatus]|uniref:low-density lipoprotein receptor-related protein 1B-like isoform X3 n=1 Tax=Cherax quadricarinatus TaxID=27406 RepID=UPI00387E37F3
MEASFKLHKSSFIGVIILLLVLASAGDTQGTSDGFEEIDWKRLNDLVQVNQLFAEEMTKSVLNLSKQRNSLGCSPERYEMEKSLASIASNLLMEINTTLEVLQNSSKILLQELARESCPVDIYLPCPKAGEFRCKTGTCIPEARRCDGVYDCRDGSDETPSCSVTQCRREGMFKCASTTECISLEGRCNDVQECSDGSDEENCKVGCTEQQFVCEREWACVPLSWLCDGRADCSDGRDETTCVRPDHSAAAVGRMLPGSSPTQPHPTPGSFPVGPPTPGSGPTQPLTPPGTTVPTTSFPTETLENICDPNMIFCGADNSCYQREWKCDGIPDCSDGSDEENCRGNQAVGRDDLSSVLKKTLRPLTPQSTTTPTSLPTTTPIEECETFMFRCVAGGRCIPSQWRCDSELDCGDGSDEDGCNVTTSPPNESPLTLCPDNQFKCLQEDLCIPDFLTCDGKNDCTDGSDELLCLTTIITEIPQQIRCGENKFQCVSNGVCISAQWRCDNYSDCLDNSDELGCSTESFLTSPSSTKIPHPVTLLPSPPPPIPPTTPPLTSTTENTGNLFSTTPVPPKIVCGEDKFQCVSDGTCIPTHWRCDNYGDCLDNSDEKDCDTGSFTIPWSTNIPPPVLLLPSPPPPPPSPPLSTTTENTGNLLITTPVALEIWCGEDKFQCGSDGACIPVQWRCDNYVDCLDNSDEEGCNTGPFTFPWSTKIPPPALLLPSPPPPSPSPPPPPSPPLTTTTENTGNLLITTPVAPEVYCYEGMFQCSPNSPCIPEAWKCDGENDCSDGSDEENCYQFTCPEDKLQCPGHEICILASWRCDGITDCPDKSDELLCATTPQDTLYHEFPTPSPLPPSTPPPPTEFVTLQTTTPQPTTPQMTSEMPPTHFEHLTTPETTTGVTTPQPNTSSSTPGDQCDSSMFRCMKSGGCIWPIFVCDGVTHCDDGTDEENCTPPPQKACTESQYDCGGKGGCIMLHFRCDGFPDCPDNSDEMGCSNDVPDLKSTPDLPTVYTVPSTTTTTSLPPLTITVTPPITTTYLPPTSFADFPSTAIQPQPTITTRALAAGACLPELGQFLCRVDNLCLPASSVCDKKHDCADGSDEGLGCEIPCPINTCSHDCMVTPNAYQCTCPPEFFLDNNTCMEGPPPAFLLVTMGRRLEAFSLDGIRNFTIVANNSAEMRGVSYDPVEEAACWSEGEAGQVYCQKLRGQHSGPQLVINEPKARFEGVAIDWLGRNVYAVDSLNRRILVCSLSSASSSSSCTTYTTFTSGVDSPKAIQLDLKKKMMYWTSKEGSTIHRAGMDGSSLQQVVGTDSILSRPSALTLDQVNHHLYWIDNGMQLLKGLSYATESNASVETVMLRNVNAFDMTFWQERLYWTDNARQQVMMCSKRDCSDLQPFQTLVQPISLNAWITIHHPDSFTQAENPCNTSSCSHLCLLSPEAAFGHVCSCPDNLTLNADSFTCGSTSPNVFPPEFPDFLNFLG